MYLFTAISAFFSILFNSKKKIMWQKLYAEESLRIKKEWEAKKGGIKSDKQKKAEDKPDIKFPDSVYTLVLLQREGRLVDFLMEDISGYEDGQIGAAVRQIHAGCRKVLEENFSLEPVFDKTEESTVTVEEGFNPDEFELTGSVSGEAPFTGTLRHKGWRCGKINLPVRLPGKSQDIVCPAEIEI